MSSRATQGLQILLIVSIMLNVVLGVTTYLYSKQAFEKANAAAAADGRAQQKDKEKQDAEAKFDRARKVIGYADLDIDALEKKNEEDQQAAGFTAKPAAAPAEGEQKQANVMGYNQMVLQLVRMRDELTNKYYSLSNDYHSLQDNFKVREAAKDNAIAKLEQGSVQEQERIKKIEDDYRAQASSSAQTETRVVSQVTATTNAANQKATAADERATNAQKAAQKAKDEIKSVIDILRKSDRKEMDIPSGEITWVSLTTKTVWINRGRADSLQRGIRFTVYSAESNTAAKAIEKGTVEVTRIVADHQAECRIVDEKFADPMTVGDKVFTAFWSPGQQVHFAFSGIMNLDGDGRNQVNEAIALVKNYGGVVDCWLDDQGRRQGAITHNTQFIVHGDPPDKGSPEMMKNNGAIMAEASRYQLHDWSLADFKARTNYQKTNSLENFGAGAARSNAGGGSPAPKATPKPKAPAAKAADDFAP